MRTLFRELALTSFANGVATLDVLDPTYSSIAQGRREQIAEIFQRVVGAPVRVNIAMTEDTAPARAQGPIDDAVTNDPIIQQAKDLFGGTIVRVEEDTSAPGSGA